MQLLSQEFCECSLMEEHPDEGYMVMPKNITLPKGEPAIPKARIDYGTGFCPIPVQAKIDA